MEDMINFDEFVVDDDVHVSPRKPTPNMEVPLPVTNTDQQDQPPPQTLPDNAMEDNDMEEQCTLADTPLASHCTQSTTPPPNVEQNTNDFAFHSPSVSAAPDAPPNTTHKRSMPDDKPDPVVPTPKLPRSTSSTPCFPQATPNSNPGVVAQAVAQPQPPSVVHHSSETTSLNNARRAAMCRIGGDASGRTPLAAPPPQHNGRWLFGQHMA